MLARSGCFFSIPSPLLVFGCRSQIFSQILASFKILKFLCFSARFQCNQNLNEKLPQPNLHISVDFPDMQIAGLWLVLFPSHVNGSSIDRSLFDILHTRFSLAFDDSKFILKLLNFWKPRAPQIESIFVTVWFDTIICADRLSFRAWKSWQIICETDLRSEFTFVLKIKKYKTIQSPFYWVELFFYCSHLAMRLRLYDL